MGVNHITNSRKNEDRKIYENGNVLLHEHQVQENTGGVAQGLVSVVKGGGSGCILLRSRDVGRMLRMNPDHSNRSG